MAVKTVDLTVRVVDKASGPLKDIAKNNKDAMNNAGGDGKSDSWLSKLQQKAKTYQRERRASGENALKKSLSAGGLTQMGADALNIGAPVMVVDAVGKAFATAAAKSEEISIALRNGSMDWKQATNQIAQSLPLIGGFVQGFNSIREIATGEKAAIAKQEEESKIFAHGMDLAIARSKELKTALEAIANTKWGYDLKMSAAGLEGYAKKQKEFENSQSEESHNLKLKEADEDKKLKESHLARIKELSDQKAEYSKKDDNDMADLVGAEIRRENDAYNAAQKKINAARVDENKSFTELQAAQKKERLVEEGEQYKTLAISYDKQVNQAKAESTAEWLNMEHNSLGAELFMLQTQTEEKKKELDKQLQNELLNNSDLYAEKIKANNKALQDALANSVNIKRAAIEKATIEDITQSILQMEINAGNLVAKQQLDKINQLKEEKDLRTKLLTILQDTNATLANKTDAKKQLDQLDTAHGEVEKAHREGLANTVKGFRDAAVNSTAQFGVGQSGVDAKMKQENTAIMDEARQKQKELQAFLATDATKAQKDAATKAYQDWAGIQGRRLDSAAPNIAAAPLATLNESRHLTGVAQRAQMQSDKEAQRDRRSEQALELQKQLLEAVKAWGQVVVAAQP